MTMTELARLAGVSQTTVSFVLNRTKGVSVAPETARRILKLARENNFRVNRAAAELRSAKSGLIGIEMPAPLQLADAWRVAMLQQGLLARGYNALFAFQSGMGDDHESLANILSRDIAGLISWDYDPILEKETLPVVLYRQPGYARKYDIVDYDKKHYAGELVGAALRGGYDQIVYMRPLGESGAELKGEAERNGIGFLHISGSSGAKKQGNSGVRFQDPGFVCEMTEKYLGNPGARRPLFASNDHLANGIYSALVRAGKRIPEEAGVIGFDNIATSKYMAPPLSTFDTSIETTMAALIDLLLARIADPGKKIENITVVPRFIMRDSLTRVSRK